MVIGSYYPINQSTSLCAASPADPIHTAGLGANWVGGGTATCAQTMGCLQQVPSGADSFKKITDCVVGADPSVTKEVSDVVRCSLLNGANAATACQAQFAACAVK
jgi:hypothetical protein